MNIGRGKRITAIGMAGVALVAMTLVAGGGAAAAAAKPSSKPSCATQTDDKWPPRVQGEPAGINPKTSAAVYMWHDSSGWHIRVTHHTTNLRTFSGQLTTTGKFARVSAVRLEKSDTFSVSSDQHDITFLFKNFGHIDGLDFHTHCAPSIKFAFQSDGKTSPPSRIVIGHNGTHPKHDPFVISR